MQPDIWPSFLAGLDDTIEPLWSAAKLVHDNTVVDGGPFGPVPFNFRLWSDNLWGVYDDTVISIRMECRQIFPPLLESPSDANLWSIKHAVAARRPMFVVPISYFRDSQNDPEPNDSLRRVAEEAWVGCSRMHAEMAVFDAWLGRLIAWRRRQGLF